MLSERLGFDVELVEAGTPKEVYKGISSGDVHLAFESWPGSNRDEFELYTDPSAPDGRRVHAMLYPDLFGYSGIYEACSRSPEAVSGLCRDENIRKSPPLLKDVLDTAEGQEFFSGGVNPSGGYKEWIPAHCQDKNCSVEILHVTPEYDKGLIEGIVEKLGLPAKVVYMGSNLTDVIWDAHTQRSGALLYAYFPDVTHHGISTLQLHRAPIHPSIDLKRQRLTKLAWPGLADRRGADALAFAQKFDLQASDYASMIEMYDLLGDPQEVACSWVRKNEPRVSNWLGFPERKNAPLFCAPSGTSGLCSWDYFTGWMCVLIQLVLCVLMLLVGKYLNRPPDLPEDYRERLDQKLIVSGAARLLGNWWRLRRQKAKMKEEALKLATNGSEAEQRSEGNPKHMLSATKRLVGRAKKVAAQAYNMKRARKDFVQAQKAAAVKAEDVNAELHQDTHPAWIAWLLEHTGNFKTRVDFTTALCNVPVVLSHTRVRASVRACVHACMWSWVSVNV